MKKPLISVVIPTYNRAPFVVEAIESILRQTEQDFEIIVVDDGSKDDTRQALEKYSGRIRYIYQDNAGCSAARNRGIREAGGEWLTFLDSDDLWLEKKLETQIGDIRAMPGAVAHATNAFIYRGHIGKETDLFDFTGFSKVVAGNPVFVERPLLWQMEYGICGWPQNLMVRREVVLATPLFDTALKLKQDMDLCDQLATKGPLIVNRTPLTRIMRRNESASLNLSNRSEDKILAHGEAIVLYRRLRESASLDDRERREVERRLSKACSSLGIELLRKGDAEAGASRLKEGYEIRPSAVSFAKSLFRFLPAGATDRAFAAWRGEKPRSRSRGR
jgi:hypothetical protein